MNYAYRISDQTITVTFMNDGRSYTVAADHENFSQIRDLIAAEDDGTAMRKALDSIASLKAQIGEAILQVGNIKVTRSGVVYKDRPLHGTIVNRIMDHGAKGLPVQPLVNFLDKLYQNPRKSAVDSLYDFLDRNDVTITPEGDFLAYKKVRSDYMDIYSGKFDNSVGKSPEMEPWDVEENRDDHCASGLHVCGKDYLRAYGTAEGNRVMVVKCDPRSVVAVPKDYNCAKMRLFKYDVIAEVTADFTPEQINGWRLADAEYTPEKGWTLKPYTAPEYDDEYPYGEDDDDYSLGSDFYDELDEEPDYDDYDYLGDRYDEVNGDPFEGLDTPDGVMIDEDGDRYQIVNGRRVYLN